MKRNSLLMFVAGCLLMPGLGGPCRATEHNASEESATPPPEDGYKLWLRYAPPGAAADEYRERIQQLVIQGDSPTLKIIRNELARATESLLGTSVPVVKEWSAKPSVLVGTPTTSQLVRELGWQEELTALGPEGYVIRSVSLKDQSVIVIASTGDIGTLYGTFHLLRLLQTAEPIQDFSILERPKVQLRMLNHWDNLNGSIERGYAGRSLWQWSELPDTLSARYTDYARANASIGINGTVLNNVNADARILTREYLLKVAALADLWRPYGIRVYVSANFAAAIRLGGLATADPLDPAVQQWWKEKAEEIYDIIPDFGGFLIKANSEGQPGPKDYNRTHAEGANMLADALAPHGGIVIWRAFVYDEDVDPDRVKRAYIEFTRLDGEFRENAVVQVKNGPIDFQPREPFHPLFGRMNQTPVFAELQATQEYLGQAKHLVYLAPMWEEFLDSDTYARGQGTTVAEVLEGKVYPYHQTGMVCVANPGLDQNWTGHHFSQANWYAFGRLAWNPELSAEGIANEWIRMTFTNKPETVATIRDMMMSSWETYVNYTMPLGLHHLIGGNHYAPMPENARAPRADWTAVYYHQADTNGIGYDRTKAGNRAVEQYFPPVCNEFNDPATCPEKFLLWFHRCPWDYEMTSGNTLWEELCETYQSGATQAAELQATWQTLEADIDPQRYSEVAERLEIQVDHAGKWRDHILKYFQQYSEMPIPQSN